jgi:hypothetical protein
MSKDVLEKFKEQKERREKDHAKIKGMFEGIRLTRLSETDANMLKLLEYVIDGFKNTGNSFDLIVEGIYYLTKRVEKLENEVKQLRTTLDTLEENR